MGYIEVYLAGRKFYLNRKGRLTRYEHRCWLAPLNRANLKQIRKLAGSYDYRIVRIA